jgi:hypothetical protein
MAHGRRCGPCGRAHSDDQRTRGLAQAQKRLPIVLRQQLLDAIYSCQAFGAVLRDLNLASNQVWGLTRTAEEWSAALEVAMNATRRDNLQHGTNAAYMRDCVCRECREHERIRMARQSIWFAFAMNSSSPRNELPAPTDRKETRTPGLISLQSGRIRMAWETRP